MKAVKEEKMHALANIHLDLNVTGEAFVTAEGPFTDCLRQAVCDTLGKTPQMTTNGGTSDARFIKDYCPVAELGLVGKTMHQIDERVSIDDLTTLTEIYFKVLKGYFKHISP